MEGGKWGLMIIFSAFMIQFLTFGTSFAMGVYAVEFLDYFDGDAIAVSFILSINIGVFLGSGPIVSYMMMKYSHRNIALIGGLMSSIGILMIPILPYIPALYIFYGVINGLGCCMAYTPSHILSGLYYNKYQSLSTGIATSGSGLGSAVMPILIGYLIEEWTWKGSLYIVSGLNLHIIVFSLLLRPVPNKIEDSCGSAQIVHEVISNHYSRTDRISVIKPFLKKHFHVFNNFGFLVYCVNNICWNMCGAINMTFLPDYLVTQGVSRIDAAFIVTICGVGTFIGGLLGAILGNIQLINRFVLFSFSNILLGISSFVFIWLSSYTLYLLNGFVYGFMFGITLGLLLVIITDILGVELLGHGLGYLLLANGIGAFSAPPIAGYLKEVYGGYEPGIYLAGVTAIVAGVLLLFIPCQRHTIHNKSKTISNIEIHDSELVPIKS